MCSFYQHYSKGDIYVFLISGLHYKHTTIVNYTSSIINKLEAFLTDNARVIIYDCHVFIVQATEHFYCACYQKRYL
jgi:hypothetical protein